jgi:translation initiation factor IF-2
MIVGGRVNKGKLEPDCLVNVFRVDQLIAQGRLLQLQLGKQNVSEVKSGQECGVKYQGKPVLAEGDILEAYKEEKVMKKLEE